MPNSKKGVTACWWLEDLTLSTGAIAGATNAFASATGAFNFQKADVKRNADKGELRDKSNNVVGEGFSNDNWEGTFVGILSGTSESQFQSINVVPQAGQCIKILDPREPHFQQDWIVSPGAAVSGDLSKPREITIPVHRFADANVTKDAV